SHRHFRTPPPRLPSSPPRRSSDLRYHLGWRLLTLNHVLLHSTAFRAEARPVMSRLVERFGETTHLGVLQDGQVMYVDKLQGTQAVRVMTDMGVRLPAHCSGVGKALLSGLSEAEVEAIAASKGLPAFTPGTITTLEELKSELARVRRRGYAYDIEEVIPELCCVAAPIR